MSAAPTITHEYAIATPALIPTCAVPSESMGSETHICVADGSDAHELTSPDTPVLLKYLWHPTNPNKQLVCPTKAVLIPTSDVPSESMGWETHMRVADGSDAHELTSPDTPVFSKRLRHRTNPNR